MNNFNIGIPKIGLPKIDTKKIGNWLKPIGTFLEGLISPSIRNIIQDKTDENREITIGGSLPSIKDYKPEEPAPQEPAPQEPAPQEPAPQEPEKPLGSSSENLTVSDNANIQKAFENLRAMQQEQWTREDEIRKHVEEREDTAYQRARIDAEKAGINLNLLGINPAQSGGGITNATGADYSMYNKEFESSLNLIMQEIEQNFKGTEAEKERFANMIGKVIQLFGFMSLKG